MSTQLRQAAQAALEALESVLCDPEGKAGIRGSDADNQIIDDALDALRAALAEPQPEPDDLCQQAADEIARLRARVLELEAVHEDASGAILQERERLRVLVEAVRDANAAASHGVLLTPGQEAAWSRLMEAL